MRIQRSVLLILIALCFGQLAGCGSQGTSISQGVNATQPVNGLQPAGTFLSQSDGSVPTVILRDPSPSRLEAFISVTIGGYERTSRETTMIGLSFQSNGRPVQFAGQEHLVCNGTTVSLHNRAAAFEVAEAQTSTLEGKAFSCTYSAGGASATLTLTVPYAPIIRSPQDLVRLPRGTNTFITYNVQGGKLLGIVALGSVTAASGPAAKAIARLDTPSKMQATVDTSAFPAGAGSISLTQTLDPQVTQTGVPFKSLLAAGTAMTMVTVTWI